MASPYYTPMANIYGQGMAARQDAQRDFADKLGQLYAGGDQKAGVALAGQAPDKLTAIRTALEGLPETEQAKAKERIGLLKKWHLAISQEPDESARALMYNQMIAQAHQLGADVSKLAPQYSREALQSQMTHLLTWDEAMDLRADKPQNNNIMKTYTDDQGNEVAVYRDGTTRVLGKAGDSFILTPDGLPFSRKSGRIITPEDDGGADAVAEARAREDARKVALAGATAAAEVTAKAGAEREGTDTQRERQTEQTLADLDQMERLAKGGVYTGGILDSAGNFMASKGVPLNQGKANRTSQIMQLATMLKFGVKPPGMGAMSDSEWKIIQDAIPDPRSSGTEGQLIAGIQEARRRLIQWKDRTSGGRQSPSTPAQQSRNRGAAALGL